jgi:redox-sensitive bicupin YhaK (pirin superfamily)
MSSPARSRIDRVQRVHPIRQIEPGARNRFVVTPGTFADQSPFVLLVEDFIEPRSGFHPHPHRGLETVTFLLEGRLSHGDHLGAEGAIAPGGVQWMTAGSGIVHGGEPLGDQSVRALQLWVALPSHLRMSAPGTREQQISAARVEAGQGWRRAVYGEGARGPGDAGWSAWPVTITDLRLDAEGAHDLAMRAGERSFAYVVEGTVHLNGEKFESGQVVWLALDNRPTALTVSAIETTRIIVYSSPPFDEPIVASGPFVMGTQAEIDQAFADLRADRFLEASSPPAR